MRAGPTAQSLCSQETDKGAAGAGNCIQRVKGGEGAGPGREKRGEWGSSPDTIPAAGQTAQNPSEKLTWRRRDLRALVPSFLL